MNLPDCHTHTPLDLCPVVQVLLAELKRLRAALMPFAEVAAGIPGNWPGYCKLRVDTRGCLGEYLCYHGKPEADLGLLPTLSEWREAAETAGGEG